MAQWVRQWESSSWLEQTQDWTDRVLSAVGVDRNGDAERVSLSLAATVWRVPTTEGDLFFKASAPPRAHEAELVTRLAPYSGGHIPVPLAVEPDEGWLLSPGIGRPATIASDLADPAQTSRIFSDAADLQLRVAAAPPDVLAEGGMPGLLPADLPAVVEEALGAHAQLPEQDPLHLAPEYADALLSRLEDVQAAADALVASGIPATLQQGELRAEQVLIPSSRRAPVMFIGWGEARWAHPFELIGSAVMRACSRFGVEPDAEPVRGMVDAYLARFSAHGSPDELRELLAPALMLSHAQRHEALMDLARAAEPEDRQVLAPRILEQLALTFGVASVTHRGRRALQAPRPAAAHQPGRRARRA